MAKQHLKKNVLGIFNMAATVAILDIRNRFGSLSFHIVISLTKGFKRWGPFRPGILFITCQSWCWPLNKNLNIHRIQKLVYELSNNMWCICYTIMVIIGNHVNVTKPTKGLWHILTRFNYMAIARWENNCLSGLLWQWGIVIAKRFVLVNTSEATLLWAITFTLANNIYFHRILVKFGASVGSDLENQSCGLSWLSP